MLPGLRQGHRMVLVVPAELRELRSLFETEKPEFEAAIGVPVTVTMQDPGQGPRWLMSTSSTAEPTLEWHPSALQLRSTAPGSDGLLAAMSLLHTVVRTGGCRAVDAPVPDRSGLVDRVVSEIAGSFPALGPRGFDWARICRDHAPAINETTDLRKFLQIWTAQLGDVHTWVHSIAPSFHPPYVARIDGSEATLLRIPEGTAAHVAGARAGWTLLDENPAEWCARSGAPAHASALVAGRRLLATPVGNRRHFSAQSQSGHQVSWTESPTPTATAWPPTVSWRRLRKSSGYLRISAWIDPVRTNQRIEAALETLAQCERLVVDLRGNAGGNLALATRTRDRFLRGQTELGSIRYSTGTGQLGDRHIIKARPPVSDSLDSHWRGEVVVLTDPLTCSASEDFVLGLQGLPHVSVAGEPSCGGSGRPRSITLTEDLRLTTSCALTYDREGRCVEGNGIPVDVPHPAFHGDEPLDQDQLVARAQR